MVLLTPGTILQDRYRVERLIGQGGFGAVYEAIDLRLNRRVALKQLLRAGERLSRQFEREAQLLANLHHAALPDVNDHFATPDGQFLVMQYVPGDDLGTLLLQRNAPFPVEQVLGWAYELLDALQYLHSRQPPIIHRDIKPQNLKLQHDGRIMLLDFGLAKGFAGELAPSTGERSLLAYTVGYAPPEQVEGLGTDERSDLYSLGATLYCLLTNAAPVEAQTRLLADARGRPDPLRPAHVLNPAVPVTLGGVLEQAMRLEPSDRPQTAAAMRTLLQDARGGVSAPAPVVPVPAFRSEPTHVEASRAAEPTALPGGRTEAATRMLPTLESEATQIDEAPGTNSVLPAPPTALPASRERAAAAPRSRGTWLTLALGGAVVLIALAAVLALQFLPRGEATDGGTVAEASAAAAEPTAEPAAETEPTAEPEPTAEAEPSQAPAEESEAEADPDGEVAARVANAMAAFERAGGLDDAIAELEAAVELEPSAELHTALAIVYMQRFRWDDVAAETERALELDPESAVAYSIRSQVYREQDDYEQAIADADRAIELDAELSLGYSARAYAVAAQAYENGDAGQLDSALSDADTAIEKAGDEDSYNLVEAYGARASAFETRYQLDGDDADLQRAIEEYRQAIGGSTQLAWHYANLGGLLSQAGRVDEAREALDRAFERDPLLYSPHETLGWLLYNQGEYAAAIESFGAAIDLSGDDATADMYYGRGLAHHANSWGDDADKDAELTAAYADLAEALSIGGDQQPWVWYELGMVQKNSGDSSASATLRQAESYYRADLETNPDDANAHDGLGWTLLALEELDAAIEEFDAALAINSEKVASYLGKSQALVGKDDTEAACQTLAEGLNNQPDGTHQELENARSELGCS